jgi:hypothetical protein
MALLVPRMSLNVDCSYTTSTVAEHGQQNRVRPGSVAGSLNMESGTEGYRGTVRVTRELVIDMHNLQR